MYETMRPNLCSSWVMVCASSPSCSLLFEKCFMFTFEMNAIEVSYDIYTNDAPCQKEALAILVMHAREEVGNIKDNCDVYSRKLTRLVGSEYFTMLMECSMDVPEGACHVNKNIQNIVMNQDDMCDDDELDDFGFLSMSF